MSAKPFEVVLLQLGVNDQSVLIVEWKHAPGEWVNRGEALAQVETGKAIFELECEQDGYFYPLTAAGTEVSIRAVIALLLPAPDEKLVQEYLRTGGISPKEQMVPVIAPPAEHDIARPTLSLAPAHRVAIYGASQGASVVSECLRQAGGYEVAAFLDDSPDSEGAFFEGIPIRPGNVLEQLPAEGVGAVATYIANARVRFNVRDRAKAAGLVMLNVIHPRAVVASSVRMGVGNLIKSGVVLDAEVQLGDCCIIDNGVILPHHNRIGSGCHLAPGATFGGDCEVGDETIIGIGATVSARIRIGRNVIIGAGAVVLRDIPDRAVVEGSPARIVGERR